MTSLNRANTDTRTHPYLEPDEPANDNDDDQSVSRAVHIGGVARRPKPRKVEPTYAEERARLAQLEDYRTNGHTPANDNRPGRGKTAYPFQELFNRRQLGRDLQENLRHYNAGIRLLDIYIEATDPDGAYSSDNGASDWQQLMPELDPRRTEAGTFVSIGANDGPSELNDDGDFEDSGSSKQHSVVDYLGYDPYRDMPAAARRVQARQTLALADRVLGACGPVVRAIVLDQWNMQQLGETEGLVDQASARAAGKGMMRVSLRALDAFFVSLDEMESGGAVGAMWPAAQRLEWRDTGPSKHRVHGGFTIHVE